MDAAEASDDSGVQPWSDRLRKQASATPNASSHPARAKDLFDVFEPDPDEEAVSMAVPTTATQFDMAASDQEIQKLEQDDHVTSLPLASPPQAVQSWADFPEEDADFSAFRFGYQPGTYEFEAIADVTTAGVRSHELRTQDGPFLAHARVYPNNYLAHARSVLPDVYPDSADEGAVTEEDVDDGHLKDFNDLADEQTRTRCGPLPHPQCGPLPHQTLHLSPGAIDDDLTDKQTMRTQCGPLPLTPGALDDDLTDKQTLRTQCGPLPRTPRVLSDTDLTDTQTMRTQCGPLPQQHAPQTPCASDGSQHAPSLFDFEGITVFDLDSNGCLIKEPTRLAPCAAAMPILDIAGLQDSLAQLVATTCASSASLDARYAALAAYSAATRQFEHSLGCTEDPCPAYVGPSSEGGQAGNLPQRRQRTQCGPLPLRSSQTPCALDVDLTDKLTLGTQCGPLPQPHMPQPLGATLDADLAGEHPLRTRRGPLPQTQCGPLPGQHMPQAPCALVTDLADEQTMRTQCGPLPQQHMPQTPCALVDYPAEQQTLGTQCGPLPQQHLPQTPGAPRVADLADKQSLQHLPPAHGSIKEQAQHAPLAFGPSPTQRAADDSRWRTQCGPLPPTQCGHLPHQHMPQAPCALDVDLAEKQAMRTQCGPLPQEAHRCQISVPRGSTQMSNLGAASKGKSKGQGRRGKRGKHKD